MNSEGDQRKDACRPVVAAWSTSGHDAPVFVDDTGRRARGVHLAGAAIATLCACWLAALVFGMSGLTGLPGAGAGATAPSRLISAQGRSVDMEPVLGAKLDWADDTEAPAAGRLATLTYRGGVPE